MGWAGLLGVGAGHGHAEAGRRAAVGLGCDRTRQLPVAARRPSHLPLEVVPARLVRCDEPGAADCTRGPTAARRSACVVPMPWRPRPQVARVRDSARLVPGPALTCAGLASLKRGSVAIGWRRAAARRSGAATRRGAATSARRRRVAFLQRPDELARGAGGWCCGCRLGGHRAPHRLGTSLRGVEPIGERVDDGQRDRRTAPAARRPRPPRVGCFGFVAQPATSTARSAAGHARPARRCSASRRSRRAARARARRAGAPASRARRPGRCRGRPSISVTATQRPAHATAAAASARRLIREPRGSRSRGRHRRQPATAANAVAAPRAAGDAARAPAACVAARSAARCARHSRIVIPSGMSVWT